VNFTNSYVKLLTGMARVRPTYGSTYGLDRLSSEHHLCPAPKWGRKWAITLLGPINYMEVSGRKEVRSGVGDTVFTTYIAEDTKEPGLLPNEFGRP
jgi:hypothetical protein